MPGKRSGRRRVKASEDSSSSQAVETIDKYLVSGTSSKRKQCWLTPPEAEGEEQSGPRSKKRQQYHIQGHWKSIADCKEISTRTLVPSPAPPTEQVPCHQSMKAAGASCYTFRNIFTCQASGCPLPPLKWADAEQVWNVLKAKDKKYVRDGDYMSRHPQLEYRMRAILLDWIIEVCEVFRLHRETFFLATDFIDRYLSLRKDVQKYQLQLIGVTALFIAAKLEEIYPPKIGEFAYTTDGACTEADIVKQEVIMLKTLNWDLTPLTINMWMTIYLNILNESDTKNETCLTKINFSRHSFVQIARLMDLAMLDEGCLKFSYGVISASILYHFGDEATTYQASGYLWDDLEECVSWLAPLAITIREANFPVYIHNYPNVLPDDQQNIQTHDISIEILDQAKQRQRQMTQAARSSPDPSTAPVEVLTPPPTKHKHSTRSSSEAEIKEAEHSVQSSLDNLQLNT